MKSKGAPEKLYLIPNGLISYRRNTDKDIEYIQTDAFIEKACEFIKERFSFEDSWHVEGETSILDKVIEDFKNYTGKTFQCH